MRSSGACSAFTARQLFKLLERYDHPGIEVLRAT